MREEIANIFRESAAELMRAFDEGNRASTFDIYDAHELLTSIADRIERSSIASEVS